ncbi:hypothetical protein OG357_05305 [Streptomyces sp. NBC_01255]|uniref:hypothetical protein n=1 Tax=Streptomyces sp. NBC_01255 TaxID=2903798 RepID=UPI002E3675CC|nr:hypothetical protein [Streptomyces sp. NBC_01255]
MSDPGVGVSVAQLLLVEYQSVKDEQKARIGFRDNLLYVTLAVAAAIIAAAAQAKQTAMLLALAPVCIVLGWTYLVNDQKISAIGRYVHKELGPRLTQLSGSHGDFSAFGWEEAHRGDARRRSRKTFQCLVDLTAFCVLPLAGLLVFWTGRPGGLLVIALSALEAIAVVGLGVQIVLYARAARRSA